MNKKIIASILLLVLFTGKLAYAELRDNGYSSITIYQVMQYVLDRYPSLKIAEMEIAQAMEKRQEVESSLGWILNSSVGITHDLTGLGTPSDRLDVNGSINRQLKSGATLSLSGGYRYEDSSLSFSPALPNPAHTTRLDLSYRFPLSQGNGNPIYIEGLISADASHDLAKANLSLMRISLADKVKDLFYSAVLTQKRMENAKQAVKRTKNLSLYITKNMQLGLSENKDQLQVNAQLHTKLAEYSAIQVQWYQLKNSLNRLMLKERGSEIKPALIRGISIKQSELNELIKVAEGYHPSLKVAQTKLDISQSQINSAKDIKKDNLDLVMSVGTRTSNGSSAIGTVDENDWAGTVSIEYKHLFNDDGVNSKYRQALLEKNIALQNILKVNDDIKYTVSGLFAEISSAKMAVKKTYQRLESESLKLKEAEKRFRSGRADTAQLIQFQNEYSFAELTYQNQRVELNKRIIALQIYTGQFWEQLQAVHGAEK